ncbi:hypothetical protein NBRC110019_19510 [Neptunitalea chrysea]|uniref:DUF4249 domain-containing protein n=2 Tax=Neptunitalea chrysea TaxID=1647581 RepID=A0A9W6EVH0_9FLAO|nr:hypothetical protein NBRC110019_19510 [Neptunitalea chrysea]
MGIGLFFTSCTDVVDVDLTTEEPNLVIEASLDWEINDTGATTGNEQTVKLSMSSPYFSQDQVEMVTGATVKVVNNATGEEYPFTDQNNGYYTTFSFEPLVNQSFTLYVEYDGESYEATDTFEEGTVISNVDQSTEGGFDTDLTEINYYFQDDATRDNFYFVKFYRDGDLLNSIETFSDEFINGNLINNFYELDDDDDDIEPLKPGDVVDINFYSITEPYYNYMNILIYQAEEVGNPFSTVPVGLQGNCKNVSGGKDAYGYFRTTQVNQVTYTVQ